jgi:hypothetical protein
MDKLRVIQWTTGKIGKWSLRAILDDPRLQLVGVYAYSDSKRGVDAGKLCGRPDCGVLATDDVDALVALKADSVIYTPFEAALSHVTRLLESGADVISTNLLMNLGGVQGAVKEQLEAACNRGDSSLYITGINPGFMNAVAVALTAACRRVDSVTISESANCATYESVETWTTLGMGLPAATPQVREAAYNWFVMFRDVTYRVADALEFKLDDVEFFCDYATASETIDLGWFRMEKGTNAAMRAGWHGKVGGRTVITMRLTWYLTKKLAEDWDIVEDEYELTVKGDPGIRVGFRFEPPEYWGNDEWNLTTALPTVNAICDVKAARAGILGLRDVGLPYAPGGLWTGRPVA